MKWLMALLLIPSSALAQGAPQKRVWIAEFSTPRVEAAGPLANLPSLIRQPNLDLSSGTAQTSAPFDSNTRYIRVVCEVQCAITASGAPAQTSDILLPADRPEYFGVKPGTTISVIAAP